MSGCASNLLRRHRPGKFRNSEASTPIADRNTADAICDLPLDRFRKRLVGGFGMRRQNAIFDPAPNLERHGKSSRYREDDVSSFSENRCQTERGTKWNHPIEDR